MTFHDACGDDHNRHVQCGHCGGCAYRWANMIVVDTNFTGDRLPIREWVCQPCSFLLAEFFHPELLEKASYLANKDQVKAAQDDGAG